MPVQHYQIWSGILKHTQMGQSLATLKETLNLFAYIVTGNKLAIAKCCANAGNRQIVFL